MKTFLSIKHWQLFLLIYCPPFFLLLAMIGFFFLTDVDGLRLILFYKLLLLVILISFGFYFSWLWSIVSFFGKYISSSTEKPKILLLLSFLCYVAVVAILYFNIDVWARNGNMEGYLEMMGIVFILGFVAAILYLYSLYLVAKVLKSAIMGKTAVWSDFIVEFILLWFYPVGIWIIQPQVNRTLKEKTRID